ncbi:hypothetical protein [Streptomyces sp. TRM49041]|uniref:hypothetical protein n=1 Tax=Streptomyces sp. TRM49041 TaxID=2603216 RepID=UPI0011EF805B|nr:hypothetical protein [Streptomyces sp. TRM49041]
MAPYRSHASALVGALSLGLVALLSSTAAATPRPAAANGPAPGPAGPSVRAEVPAGVTAGVAVLDRRTGTFTEQLNAGAPFRSASVVKLLITLDLLWNRGPDALSPADRTRVDAMLRGSDDSAASHFWANNGQGAVIDRMVPRLGLTDTARPPATHLGYWGYTALSARDTVKIYRHLLDSAPAAVRDYVLGNLRRSTRCAADGYDQHFGVAGAFDRPWAVKQGWSGFSSGGCTATAAARTTAPDGPTTRAAADVGTRAAAGADAVDLTRPALHTTGVVGAGDRSIVAVLTLHPQGTPYGKAYSDLGRLTRSLNVPGASRPAGTWIGTWGSGVRVRAGTTTGSSALTTLPAGVEVLVSCQKRGRQVSVPPYVNDWWAHLPQYGGYMTNIYVKSPDNRVPGVPVCA